MIATEQTQTWTEKLWSKMHEYADHGERVPTLNQLARDLGTKPVYLRQCLDRLRRMGWVRPAADKKGYVLLRNK